MAALGKIRKRGALLIGIIGLGLFGFIAGDVFRSCETQTNEQRMQVGEVLGKKLSQPEYQALVEEYTEVQRWISDKENFTEDETNNFRDQVWSQYESSVMFTEEAEKLGLVVTDEEMEEAMLEGTNPVFRNMLPANPDLRARFFVFDQTGRLNVAAVQQILDICKNLPADVNPDAVEVLRRFEHCWNYTERQLRESMLTNKYFMLLYGCMMSNPVAAKQAFEAQSIENDILLASVPYSTINDSLATPTDADLKAEYNALKEAFVQPVEVRDIKYVKFEVTPSEADRDTLFKSVVASASQLKDSKDLMNVLRKANSKYAYNGLLMPKKIYSNDIVGVIDTLEVGEVSAPFETVLDNTYNVVKLVAKAQLPDSVQLRVIQVGGTDIEDSKKRADSILVALKGGANFDTLAVKYNGAPAQKEWITADMMSSSSAISLDGKKQITAFFTTGKDEIVSETLSNGWSLIVQVLDRRAFSEKYDVAVIKKEITFSDETYNNEYKKFSKYVSENQSVDSLEANAAAFGYTVLSSPIGGISSDVHKVDDVAGTGDAIKWIFDEAEVGDISQLYEGGENKEYLLVVALTGINKKGYSDFDRVKNSLLQKAITSKKFEQAKASFADVKDIASAQAKGLRVDTVRQITAAAPVHLSYNGATEPALSRVVGAMEEGKFSPAVIKGERGAYMLQVLKKSPIASAQFNEKTVEMMLSRNMWNNVTRAMQFEFILNANIVDNRYMFY